MEAILDKDISRIEELIEQAKQAKKSFFSKDKLRINAQDKTGLTALMWAIIQDLPLDTIQKLLSVKIIDINKVDNDGLTALDHAVMHEKDEIVQVLLNICVPKVGSICPLVNQRDKKLKLTPLARATIADNSMIINLLLQAGSNPTTIITRHNKQMPMSELSELTDDKETAELIKIKAKDFRARTLDFMTALKQRRLGDAERLFALGINVNVKDERGFTPLHWAVLTHNKDLIMFLISNNAHINDKDKSGYTPLHMAIPSHNIAVKEKKEIIKLLIANKADVNAKDNENRTPIHIASIHGPKEIVKILIEARADVNAKSGCDDTPLHYAAQMGKKDIVKLLIAAGSDVMAVNKSNARPSREAIRFRNHDAVYKILRKAEDKL